MNVSFRANLSSTVENVGKLFVATYRLNCECSGPTSVVLKLLFSFAATGIVRTIPVYTWVYAENYFVDSGAFSSTAFPNTPQGIHVTTVLAPCFILLGTI